MSRLRAMELFVHAVRDGSFSAAGRRVGLSPAAGSRPRGELEAALGAQLVHRTSRSLSLTEAGQAYFQRVEAILQNIKDAEAAASAMQATPRGTLRVHSRMLFGMTVVAPLIPDFQALYPELKVELRLSERAAMLRDDEFDIDLRIGPPQDPSLMQRRLLATERILVAAPDYLASRQPIAGPHDLAAHNCMAYWLGPEDPVWRFLKDGRMTEIIVNSRFVTNNGQILRLLAVAGHGIALLDSYTVLRDIAAGRLVQLLPDHQVTNTTFERGIYAAFRRMPFVPVKIKAFLEFLAERVPALVRGGRPADVELEAFGPHIPGTHRPGMRRPR